MPAYIRLQTYPFFQGPHFINFQTGSIKNTIQSSSIYASTNLLLNQPQPNQSIILTAHQSNHSGYCHQNTVTRTQARTQNTAIANRSNSNIFDKVYATCMCRTCVHTHFPQDELGYRSTNQIYYVYVVSICRTNVCMHLF